MKTYKHQEVDDLYQHIFHIPIYMFDMFPSLQKLWEDLIDWKKEND
jgi:hypothetical protein